MVGGEVRMKPYLKHGLLFHSIIICYKGKLLEIEVAGMDFLISSGAVLNLRNFSIGFED